ncbi:MAG: hypothetical protein QOH93_1014, partial [Chloroflexia bacterium]|nr:hypothetical protein [Chloroflexia bacterium]
TTVGILPIVVLTATLAMNPHHGH